MFLKDTVKQPHPLSQLQSTVVSPSSLMEPPSSSGEGLALQHPEEHFSSHKHPHLWVLSAFQQPIQQPDTHDLNLTGILQTTCDACHCQSRLL